MNMSKTAAISKARREVSVCRFGRDYVVHTWDERAKGTRISHTMPYINAMTAAAAAKLTAALVNMGWNHEDATHVAYNWEPGTRWEALVREDN
jgi:hypothetical protein